MIIERWKNINTFTIGKLHISQGTVCQDRTYYLEKNGVKVVALADGAGSKAKSEIGAELVCKSVAKLLTENFVDYLLYFEYEKADESKHKKNMNKLSKIIISSLVEELKIKAKELNLPFEELSSTMLFVAMSNKYYIMGHIGDGVIAGLFSENNTYRVKIMSYPENGERSNITFFVPDSNADEHLRLKAGSLEGLRGVMLTSDGAGGVLFSQNQVDKAAYELFVNYNGVNNSDYENAIQDYLKNVISNYSNDDLSLNILYLEDINTDIVSNDYLKYLFSNIKSSTQILQKSQYCYYLDSSINVDKGEFASINEIKEYLKWK